MIRLRPYYLFSLLRQLDAGDEPIEENSLPEIVRLLIASNFHEDIQLIQTFCDACRNCPKMVPDPAGCLWGPGYRCDSADTPRRLAQVENQMRSILYDLDMHFDDVMRADKLILRAIERRPYHYFHIPQWQETFERGAKRFCELTGLSPHIKDELLEKKKFYIS